MPLLDRTLPLVRTNLALFARDPGPLLGRIAQPVLLVLLLRPLYASALGDRTRGTTQLVVGHLVLFSLLGMSVVGTAMLTERRWCTFDRLRATPARPAELLAGKAIPILLFLLVQQGILLALGIAVLDLPVASYWLLLLAALMWTVTVLCLGAAVAVLVRSYAQLTAVTDIGSTVLAGLSGALVPLAAMPGWAQAVAPGSPAYWAMTGLRAALSGDVRRTVVSAAALAGIAALAATIAGRQLARGWGRSTLL
jgi:ABC-2 type transport system permease protein